ncbi:MAG: YheC/YheD family protein [Alicyclobacillaceae bacterium]|nr:YheC/YheD family protein [Alicyclobacillaceae bacterium]
MLVVLTGALLSPADSPRRLRAFQLLSAAGQRCQLPVLITTPAWRGKAAERVVSCQISPVDGLISRSVTRIDRNHIVVYDAMYLSELRAHRQMLRALGKRLAAAGVPRFNPVLPGKDAVYRCLQSMNGSAQLPSTWYAVRTQQVVRLMNDLGRLWLKPVRGSGGRNVVYIEQVAGGGIRRWRVLAERCFGSRVDTVVDEAELQRWVARALRRRTYLAQAHVALAQTSDGRPLDVRATVARDGAGRWQVAGLTARVAPAGSLWTNYHAGGDVYSLTRFSQDGREPLPRPAILPVWLTDSSVLSAIGEAAVQAAGCLQQRWPALGVLGVDVAPTADSGWFVYDCNSRPGRDILTDWEVEAMMELVAGFARHLYDRRPGALTGGALTGNAGSPG